MYPIWILDHSYLVTLLIIAIAVGVAFAIYQYSLRVSEQHPAKSQLAAFGVQLTIAVLITFFLNNLHGAARDRDQQKWTLRQNHLAKLQPVLRADSEMLKHVAGQATKVGRISTLQDSTATDVVELATLFSSDVLTPDLANHYQEYWRDRHQLLQDIQQQDTKFGDIVALVSKPLHLPDHAENQRIVIGRAFLEKCLGKGPGFTLEISKNEYTYGILGNGNSKNSSRLPVPEHLMAMSEAFRSILPDAETIKNCEALTNGAASIAARATKLVGEAKVLAERTVLAGDCEYTRLD